MEIREHVSLASYSTFRIGGDANFFAIAKSKEDFFKAFEFAGLKKIPVFVLGGGSNIIFSDKGFNGLIIKNEISGITYEDKEDYVLVKSKSGESWDHLVEETVSRNLYGLENLSLIPGTVGASPVQNIGAYGKEASDVIKKVLVFDPLSNTEKYFSNKECKFGYRTSVFKDPKHKNLIITEVIFKLSKKGKLDIEYKDLKDFFSTKKQSPTLKEVRDAVIFIRTNKMPDLSKVGTAGSFWKNPIISKEHALKLKKQFPEIPLFDIGNNLNKVPLAWVLDNVLHMKGYKNGNVGLYKNQPLVVFAEEKSQFSDIDQLTKLVAKKVFDSTDIVIEKEVEYVG